VGVIGKSVGGPFNEGMQVLPASGDGVQGTGENGVHGISSSTTNNGVLGENSSSGAGVKGTSVAGYGVSGASTSNDGVYGESSTGFGLHGRNTYFFIPTVAGAQPATTSTPPPPSAASSVKAKECGVFGESLGYEGVFGVSAFQHGVHGVSGQISSIEPPAGGCGVWGDSVNTTGVYGTSASGQGVQGVAAKISGSKPAHPCGVWGDSSEGYGVCATSSSTNGLWASSASDHGVLGQTSSQSHAGVYGWTGDGSGKTPQQGAGVWGDSDQGIGVYGASKSGKAGRFDGDVAITGNHTVTGKVAITGDHTVTGKVAITGDHTVTGNAATTGNHTVSGNVSVAGDIVLTGADCAERFDLGGCVTAEAGTVMVIGQDGALRPSHRSYDCRVAGVVSGAGAFRPGIVLDKRADDECRTTIALVGKVYCKVDADQAPISVGDMLTTSDTPGHAMKVIDRSRAFGSVIGKALGALEAGSGLLPILIALQ
jgi:hypothetical protein